MAFTPVQKLSITSGAAMVLLSAVGVVSYLSTSQLTDAQEAAAHTNETINRLDRVRSSTIAAEGAVGMFVATAGASARASVDSLQGDVEAALDSLRVATEDHPDQRRMLDSLGPIIGAHFREVRQIMLIREKVSRDSAAALIRSGPITKGVSPARLLSDMRDEEVRVLGERSRVMAASGKASRTLIVAGSLFALILALVALQPLRASVERRLTARLSRAETIPEDEVKG